MILKEMAFHYMTKAFHTFPSNTYSAIISLFIFPRQWTGPHLCCPIDPWGGHSC